MNASEKTRPEVSFPTIDLNADLGEGFPNDRALLERVSSASISCGAHAGSPEIIRQTLLDARDCGVVVGAHPGYPDREHFGRLDRAISAEAVRGLILDQVASLVAIASDAGVSVRFLKPHGALYNQAQRQDEIARGVVAAAFALGLPLLGQPGTILERMASEHGLCYVAEGFPDRRYRDDGSLVPRNEPGAVLHDPDEMENNLLRLAAEGRVVTLCIHGDDSRAVANAQIVRRILEGHRITIRPFVADG
jgi:5-oxoprolinase (ATP-hydrolysing) subunit A